MYQKRNKELELIIPYLGNYKSRFYLRQLSKLSQVPLKTTQNILTELEKNKLLKSKTEGKNKYFSLNLENTQTKHLVLQAEIYKTNLFLIKYPPLKPLLKNLNSNTPVMVFGSFAKFKTDKNSDLDILTISTKTELPTHLIPHKIHQVNLTESTFSKALQKNEPLIKEIEENHVILNNHSFYVNLMWSHYGK